MGGHFQRTTPYSDTRVLKIRGPANLAGAWSAQPVPASRRPPRAAHHTHRPTHTHRPPRAPPPARPARVRAGWGLNETKRRPRPHHRTPKHRMYDKVAQIARFAVYLLPTYKSSNSFCYHLLLAPKSWGRSTAASVLLFCAALAVHYRWAPDTWCRGDPPQTPSFRNLEVHHVQMRYACPCRGQAKH